MLDANGKVIKPIAKWKYIKQLDKAIHNVTTKFYADVKVTEVDVQRINTWFNKLKKHIEGGL